MALLGDVRNALATAVAAVPGLSTSALMTGQVTPPMAVILPGRGTFLTYDETFEAGVSGMALEIVLLVSYADERAAQQLLDGYLSATGPSSVKAAVAAYSFAGVADWAVVESADGYGIISWAGVDYLGARLQVTAGTQ